MNVNFNNVGFYNYGAQPLKNTQSFKSIPSLNLMQNNGINAQDYQNRCNNARGYDEKEQIRAEYIEKVKSVIFDENGKLDKRIVEFLDNAEFEFGKDCSEKCRIKDMMKKSIYSTSQIDTTMYHATGSEEAAKNIVENGFDPDRINRTLVGPGFYFSPSRDCTLMYNNYVLKAQIKGTCACVDSDKIQKINESNISQKLGEFIGLEGRDYDIGMSDAQIKSKIIDSYVRTSFYEDLGVDVVSGNGGGISCYAVYNPSAIKSIEYDGSSASIPFYY